MTETSTDHTPTAAAVLRPEIAERIDRLPSLSNVVGEFLEMSASEFITAKDFERVICKDQALVGRLLKTANSGKYGKSRSINSISEAVVLIGLDNMKKIVYAVSSEGLLRQEFEVYRYPGRGFWMHSLGVATASRVLIEAAKSPSIGAEAVFVAGLIHDVGKLIIDEFLETTGSARDVTLDEERAAAGVDHVELGAHIMSNWNLPESIAQAARWHHHPGSAGDSLHGALAVGMADAICNHWGVGTEPFMDLGEEIDPEPHFDALEHLGIPSARLEPILFDLRQRLVSLEEMFGRDD